MQVCLRLKFMESSPVLRQTMLHLVAQALPSGHPQAEYCTGTSNQSTNQILILRSTGWCGVFRSSRHVWEHTCRPCCWEENPKEISMLAGSILMGECRNWEPDWMTGSVLVDIQSPKACLGGLHQLEKESQGLFWSNEPNLLNRNIPLKSSELAGYAVCYHHPPLEA